MKKILLFLYMKHGSIFSYINRYTVCLWYYNFREGVIREKNVYKVS